MGPAPEWLDQRLLVFTGKGGTGKSTVAAAAAVFAAEHGRRVLLVDVDAKQSVVDFLEHAPVGFDPVEVYPGVRALAMDTEASLREYLKLNLKVPVVARIGPLARAFDFVATAAPGVKEILTIGKIAWEVREAIAGRADHDLVIVDGVASGHVVAQLNAAQTIRDLADVGPLRAQTDWMIELLTDPAITSVNIVTTPEEMPVAETIELVERIRTETAVPLGNVIVNRVLPELFTRADEACFDTMRRPEVVAAIARALGTPTGSFPASLAERGATRGVDDVLAGARLAVMLRRARVEHLDDLRRAVDLPLLYLPYQFGGLSGVRMVRVLAQALGEELGW